MKKALNLTIVTFYSLFLYGQNSIVSIHFDEKFADDTHLKAIVVSNQNGEILHERFFDNDFSEKDKTILLNQKQNEKIHVTVVKASYNLPDNKIDPQLQLYTICNIQNGIEISDYFVPRRLSASEIEEYEKKRVNANIEIINIDNFDYIEMNYPTSNTLNTRKRKNRLLVDYHLLKDTDSYFWVYQKNGDSKMVYLPYEKSGEFPTVDFSELSSDFTSHKIHFPKDNSWQISISAINEMTGNSCYLSNYRSGRGENISNVNLYLPTTEFFFDFNIHTSRWDRNSILGSDSRTKCHQWINKMDELPDSIILQETDYTLELENDETINLSVEEDFDFFEITREFIPNNQISTGYIYSSTWTFLGEVDENKQIRLPNFSSEFYSFFSTFPKEFRIKSLHVNLVKIMNSAEKEDFYTKTNSIFRGQNLFTKPCWVFGHGRMTSSRVYQP